MQVLITGKTRIIIGNPKKLFANWVALFTFGLVMFLGVPDAAAKQQYFSKEEFLASSSVTAEIVGCIPIAPEYFCDEIPVIQLKYRSISNSRAVLNIRGKIGQTPFSCEGDFCNVALNPTSSSGAKIKFWAELKGGVSTDRYTLRYRVLDTLRSGDNARKGWRVDIVSIRLINSEAPDYYHIWDMLPPLENQPRWLRTPANPKPLSTQRNYYYLAGKLILWGFSEASECPAGGLEGNGYATECGMEAAQSDVIAWQNRFDRTILRVSRQMGIPARLMKNLFARESQLWPADYGEIEEYGLGHITDLGADALLLWNPALYRELCHTYAGDTSPLCITGYGELEDLHQAILRGMVLAQSSAYCPKCYPKIDMSRIEENVRIFGWSLQASASQTGQVVRNVTGKAPQEAVSYENMWKFTLVNYNSGPNCLYDALEKTWGDEVPLNWKNTSPNIKEFCDRSVRYVNDISN